MSTDRDTSDDDFVFITRDATEVADVKSVSADNEGSKAGAYPNGGLQLYDRRLPTVFYRFDPFDRIDSFLATPGVYRGIVLVSDTNTHNSQNIEAAYRFNWSVSGKSSRFLPRYRPPLNNTGYPLPAAEWTESNHKIRAFMKETSEEQGNCFNVVEIEDRDRFNAVSTILTQCQPHLQSKVVVGVRSDPTMGSPVNTMEKLRFHTPQLHYKWGKLPERPYDFSQVPTRTEECVKAAERFYRGAVAASQSDRQKHWQDVAKPLMNGDNTAAPPFQHHTVKSEFIDWLEKEEFNFLKKVDSVTDEDIATRHCNWPESEEE